MCASRMDYLDQESLAISRSQQCCMLSAVASGADALFPGDLEKSPIARGESADL